MNNIPRNRLLSTAILSVIISACGGGGGGSSTGTTGSDVLSSGVITQFGSVYVNGVRYDTANTRVIRADDGSVVIENPSNAQLRQYLGLGQLVLVQGSANSDGSNGVATAVIFDHQLRGPVSSVSNADSSLLVLGQTVAVTPDTIIDDSIIEALTGSDSVSEDLRFADIAQATGQQLSLEQLIHAGMVLEISGLPTPNGLEATRIEDVDNRERSNGADDGVAGEVEIKGFISQLSDSQFQLGGLTVEYEISALDEEDFAEQDLQDGQFVEVKGSLLSTTLLSASAIELEEHWLQAHQRSSAERMEIEGIITAITPDASGSGGTITINGTEIAVSDISGLSEGQRVEIKGQFQDGVLLIARVQDEIEDNIRIDDLALSNDGSAIQSRLGVSIAPSARTRLVNDLSDDLQTLNDFIAAADGHRIEARGFKQDAAILWTRLRITQDDSGECRLRGPVASISGDSTDFSFVIEGVSIDVSQIGSDNGFQGEDGAVIGRSAFFTRLSSGGVVEAHSITGGCSDGSLIAREVEFEHDEANSFESENDDNTPETNERRGAVSAVTLDSFQLGGETIAVTANTLIDDSLIEAARGQEVEGDRTLGSLSETLPELLPDGLIVEVSVDGADSPSATRIEDI